MTKGPTDPVTDLAEAILKQEKRYTRALDRLADEDREDYWAMREAVELVRCLRRLVKGRTPQEIHRAFGAPGDFGYDTPIGDALARLYRVAAAQPERHGQDDKEQ